MDQVVTTARRLKRERQLKAFSATHQRDGDGYTISLGGTITLRNGTNLWLELNRPQPKSGETLRVDLTRVGMVDGTATALLVSFRARCEEAGIHCELIGAEGAPKELLKLYERDAKLTRRVRRRPQGLLDQLGAATIRLLVEVQLVLAFFGQMVVGVFTAIRSPRTVNWREVTPIMERAGADAVPIVGLINFLVGLVMALQSATQLRRFGADIFIADLIGISVTREIGPLMTAIIICGRTGSSFAAELGTMKTNEEIDALRTMGFGQMRWLVMPRALALMAVAPLLTIIADLCGCVGGLMVGVYRLDLTTTAYLTEMQRAVKMGDITQGLVKSVAFALATALVSCQQGLATTGGAEGVGRRTTAAVVTTLFTLILIDVVFTAFFEAARMR
ncbi:MAG TPA: MlaE family lipid ABC transporter permease subunit [Polyangiales bacterium]|nr:MlaE family lipid ABC transporter permease subunit [Polyangiales bacterium]